MNKLLFVIPLVLLFGCKTTQSDEDFLNQAAHFTVGAAVACDLVSNGATEEQAIDFVNRFAQEREDFQHAKCGEGCQRDLKYWKEGAQVGAKECSK